MLFVAHSRTNWMGDKAKPKPARSNKRYCFAELVAAVVGPSGRARLGALPTYGYTVGFVDASRVRKRGRAHHSNGTRRLVNTSMMEPITEAANLFAVTFGGTLSPPTAAHTSVAASVPLNFISKGVAHNDGYGYAASRSIRVGCAPPPLAA